MLPKPMPGLWMFDLTDPWIGLAPALSGAPALSFGEKRRPQSDIQRFFGSSIVVLPTISVLPHFHLFQTKPTSARSAARQVE
jgi:hypothetical protein